MNASLPLLVDVCAMNETSDRPSESFNPDPAATGNRPRRWLGVKRSRIRCTAIRKTLSCAAILVALSATADANWYSGDPYTGPTAWPQYTDNLSDGTILALTYDNFNWVHGDGDGVVYRVGGHFHSFNSHNGSSYDTAYWEIRSGMAHNVAGTLLYSGGGAAQWSPTTFLQDGAPVWRVDVRVPYFTLPAGNYWFGLAIGTSSGFPQGAFVASTSGANGIGGPLGDDISIYFQSDTSGVTWNYVDSATFNAPHVTTGFDPSYFVFEVPEPCGLAAAGMGAIILLGIFRRRRARV